MKTIKALRDLQSEEVEARLRELRKEVLKQNSQVHSGANVANVGKFKQSKKNIARLMMVLHERRKV